MYVRGDVNSWGRVTSTHESKEHWQSTIYDDSKVITISDIGIKKPHEIEWVLGFNVQTNRETGKRTTLTRQENKMQEYTFNFCVCNIGLFKVDLIIHSMNLCLTINGS